MTAHAKTVAAAFAAVLITAITAWQTVGNGGFRVVDLLPVAVIVLGAVQTHLIPNVPELPWAKTVVAGSSAVIAGVATYVASDPTGYTAAKLLTVASGAFLVWFVPELEGVVELAAPPQEVPALTPFVPPAPRHEAPDLSLTQPIPVVTDTPSAANAVPSA